MTVKGLPHLDKPIEVNACSRPNFSFQTPKKAVKQGDGRRGSYRGTRLDPLPRMKSVTRFEVEPTVLSP